MNWQRFFTLIGKKTTSRIVSFLASASFRAECSEVAHGKKFGTAAAMVVTAAVQNVV